MLVAVESRVTSTFCPASRYSAENAICCQRAQFMVNVRATRSTSWFLSTSSALRRT